MQTDNNQLASQRVTIIGLGLMGGSLALILRPHVGQLIAVDSDAATREQALRAGVVNTVTDDLALGATQADLVILATPVRHILSLLQVLPQVRPDGCFVLDLGSTKQAIVAAMEGLPPAFAAIGGHPLCGREQSGLAAASADLYRGQTFVLCRNERTTVEMTALALSLIEAIGARPLFMDAAEHDSLVALTSHLPYLVASVLIRTAAEAGDGQAWQLSASGFRDTSRLAGSDPAMMLDILLTNRDAILERLEAYGQGLARIKGLLQDGDKEALLAWLAAAQGEHRDYQAAKGQARNEFPAEHTKHV